MQLPIIDISPLNSDHKEDWAPVIAQIDKACRELGFFYVIGHGIPNTQFEHMKATASDFFSLPIAEKKKISIENSENHRGWGALNAEQLDSSGPQDCKETFDMALDLPLSHPQVQRCKALYGPNQYPESPSFIQTVNHHYQMSLDVGLKLLKVMALALGEREDFFVDHFQYPISVLRLIQYPVQTDHTNGAGAHTDYGCITLLYQDNSGGLQVQSVSGDWIDAIPVEGSLVVNIGDLMQRWTNGLYQSTPHRVTSPTSGRERFSMPFFVEPDFDTPVKVLSACVEEKGEKLFEDTTAGEWILSRFSDTYSYREE
ncbi:isopenicillin N synthase family dioxygenase [Vibrio sp. WJH972]